MSQFRRYIVPGVVFAVAILVCGKLLLTPVWRFPTEAEEELIGLNPGSARLAVHQYGWPWIFWQTYEFNPIWKSLTFSWPLLVADIAILLAALAFVALLLAWNRWRSCRWLCYSLRELLATIMLVAGATAWLVHERNEQRQEYQDEIRFAPDDITILRED